MNHAKEVIEGVFFFYCHMRMDMRFLFPYGFKLLSIIPFLILNSDVLRIENNRALERNNMIVSVSQLE